MKTYHQFLTGTKIYETKLVSLYPNYDLGTQKLFEADEFMNRVGFAESLVGRAVNGIFSMFGKNVNKIRLARYRRNLENEYLAGVVRSCIERQVDYKKVTSATGKYLAWQLELALPNKTSVWCVNVEQNIKKIIYTTTGGEEQKFKITMLQEGKEIAVIADQTLERDIAWTKYQEVQNWTEGTNYVVRVTAYKEDGNLSEAYVESEAFSVILSNKDELGKSNTWTTNLKTMTENVGTLRKEETQPQAQPQPAQTQAQTQAQPTKTEAQPALNLPQLTHQVKALDPATMTDQNVKYLTNLVQNLKDKPEAKELLSLTTGKLHDHEQQAQSKQAEPPKPKNKPIPSDFQSYSTLEKTVREKYKAGDKEAAANIMSQAANYIYGEAKKQKKTDFFKSKYNDTIVMVHPDKVNNLDDAGLTKALNSLKNMYEIAIKIKELEYLGVREGYSKFRVEYLVREFNQNLANFLKVFEADEPKALGATDAQAPKALGTGGNAAVANIPQPQPEPKALGAGGNAVVAKNPQPQPKTTEPVSETTIDDQVEEQNKLAESAGILGKKVTKNFKAQQGLGCKIAAKGSGKGANIQRLLGDNLPNVTDQNYYREWAKIKLDELDSEELANIFKNDESLVDLATKRVNKMGVALVQASAEALFKKSEKFEGKASDSYQPNVRQNFIVKPRDKEILEDIWRQTVLKVKGMFHFYLKLDAIDPYVLLASEKGLADQYKGKLTNAEIQSENEKYKNWVDNNPATGVKTGKIPVGKFGFIAVQFLNVGILVRSLSDKWGYHWYKFCGLFDLKMFGDKDFSTLNDAAKKAFIETIKYHPAPDISQMGNIPAHASETDDAKKATNDGILKTCFMLYNRFRSAAGTTYKKDDKNVISAFCTGKMDWSSNRANCVLVRWIAVGGRFGDISIISGKMAQKPVATKIESAVETKALILELPSGQPTLIADDVNVWGLDEVGGMPIKLDEEKARDEEVLNQSDRIKILYDAWKVH